VICTSRALRLAPAIALLLVAGLIASAGFSAGFHRRVPANEWGRFVFTLSSAITAVVYGVDGHVSFEPVEAALKARGLTSDVKILAEIGGTFPENFADENLITRAIQHASSLEVRIPSPEFQNEKYNVRPAGGDDLGFSALATLAFWLFSHSITAIYACYLLILAIPVFLFWLAFRNEQAYLAVLLLMCAVIYALFLSPLFPGIHGRAWESPLSGHFLSTLAFVPMLHVLAVHCRCPKPTLGQILCLAAQAGILYFAVRLRASAVWTVGPIFCAACLVCLRSTQICRLEPSMRIRFQKCARQCWPALLFLLTALCVHVAFESRLHPVYRQGNHLSRHAFWPEVFYGLQSHPQWADKYGSMYLIRGEMAVGDQLPVAAVLRYLDLHTEIDRSQLLDRVGTLPWGAIEHYSMLALWDFVRTAPWFAVECFGYKLNGLLSVLKAMPEWVFGSFSVPTILFFALLAICAAYALSAASIKQTASFRSYLMLLALCVPASWLPNIVTLVGWEFMADAIVSWFLFSSVLVAWVASIMAKAVPRLLSAWIEAHRTKAAGPERVLMDFSPSTGPRGDNKQPTTAARSRSTARSACHGQAGKSLGQT
jgi:hypothetical protein